MSRFAQFVIGRTGKLCSGDIQMNESEVNRTIRRKQNGDDGKEEAQTKYRESVFNTKDRLDGPVVSVHLPIPVVSVHLPTPVIIPVLSVHLPIPVVSVHLPIPVVSVHLPIPVVNVIIIIIINLTYIAQFDTNSILTALYIVITYIQMQYVHVCTYAEQSYKYTYTCLHIRTYTVTCTNIHLPTY